MTEEEARSAHEECMERTDPEYRVSFEECENPDCVESKELGAVSA